MTTIKAIYKDNSFQLLQPVPVTEDYEVITKYWEDNMKIKDMVCVNGKSGFFFDDLAGRP